MSRTSKYQKVEIGATARITARNSLQGMVVLADFNDAKAGKRVLVLERSEKATAVPEAAKPATMRKKRQTNGAAEEPKKEDSRFEFPGERSSTTL